MTDKEKPTGLELLRQPFPDHQISKLPKPTKRQTDEVKADYTKGIRCGVCGGWHHPGVIHLDYVGHAALTDRLLDADPNWNWEPMAFAENGAPALDGNGGLWIKLTVCGVSRFGYGHADGKQGGDAIKEAIGDAMRNAAMRFGAALDLWHKGNLHEDEEPETPDQKPKPDPIPAPEGMPEDLLTKDGKFVHREALRQWVKDMIHDIEGCGTENALTDLEDANEVVIAVVKEHKPEYWHGAQDFEGLESRIGKARASLSQLTAAE